MRRSHLFPPSGAKPSYENPVRYSFTLGGEDGTPYPVDRDTYDKTLAVLERGIRKSNLRRLRNYFFFRDANTYFILFSIKRFNRQAKAVARISLHSGKKSTEGLYIW